MSRDSLSGYVLLETLFESGKSLIYRAQRETDSLLVVIKVIHSEYPTLEQVSRLRREYRMTGEAQVEGVVRVFALERFKTGVAMVLEDIGGLSLAHLASAGPLETRQLLSLAVRLAGTLGRVHQRRIIHKDINPSNIVYNPSTDVMRLIDFGLATELAREMPALVGPRVLEGTLPYLSPEQTGRMNRALDYRTDLYSLGVTLYQLATGCLPFTATDPMALVHAHIAQVPVAPHELVASVPRAVSAIILRLLAKRAEDRYQSAFALQADLEHCAALLESGGQGTPFEVGRGDASDVLRLPQKLYGREREVEALLGAFGRVAEGGRELMLVAGYSGIGKSALVNEVHKPIVARRGYFISGKFDQLNRNIPYASLIQAVQALVRQLLTESAEELARWRERILTAVGRNGQVIIDVIQEVEFVIGEQPPVPELPPTEARNRFNFTFENFFRVFASQEHPLTMFLDDLQWADLPSLLLLERLMLDAGMRYLFLVGAYRDNEVAPGHPLLVTVETLQKEGARVGTLSLSPLRREDCLQLLVDTLRCEPREAGPLAELCLHKTDGNPFFLGQFLLSLHARGEFLFDARSGRWTWDDARIARMDMTDNVVELMAGKILTLPERAQHALRVAACIGNVFELRTLAVVLEEPATEVAAALWPGLKEGLLLPVGDSYKFVDDEAAGRVLLSAAAAAQEASSASRAPITYRFLHDRVQQAASSLVPPERRSALHLQIGRQLLRGAGGPEREERLFSLVGHLNLGAGLLEDPVERDELAALNLAAGKKAKASAAHAAALEYFDRGLALLGEEGFTRRHELAIALHLQAAEASYLDKKFDRIDLHARAVLAHSQSVLDQVKIAEIQIEASTVQDRAPEGLHIALEILKVLGVEFPAVRTPEALALEIRELDAALEGRSIESLIGLPTLTDPVKVAVLRILAMVSSTSCLCDPLLFPFIAIRPVAFSVAHGNAGPSANAYSVWGTVLSGMLGRIDEGYAFGALALRTLERYDAKEHEARVQFIVSSGLTHLKQPVLQSLKAFQHIYRTSHDTGDLNYAGFALSTESIYLLLGGAALDEVEEVTASNLRAAIQLRNSPASNWLKTVRQTVLVLRERVEIPAGGGADEQQALLASLQQVQDLYGVGCMFLSRLMLSCLFEDVSGALENADRGREYLASMVGHYQLLCFFLYDSLAQLAHCSEASAEARQRALERVEENLQRLKPFADISWMNHGHKFSLIQAERARVLGESQTARECYYRAMAQARANGCRHEEALATERFAHFAREQGERELADLFLVKARYLYETWGARAKVRQMERKHRWLASAAATARTPTSSERPLSTTEEQALGSSLDLLSVLKASQAISGEVLLPELLKKLMHVMVENAGARRGLLMLEGEVPLGVEAERTLEHVDIRLSDTPVEQREDLCLPIVRYVQRTHQTVVLDDAARAGPFMTEPYVVQRQAKSVLCQPILQQKKLMGVLYLENELATGAFTPERCQVLELLCAQAAISLENANVYTTLDVRVRERTRELASALDELRAAQQRLVLQEKQASLGMLMAGIAHEIKNPLNFIINFAESSGPLFEELSEELPGAGEHFSEKKAQAVEGLVSELRGNVERICRHGQRANGIVQAMMNHSREGGRVHEPADLNALVREYVPLACHGFHQQEPSFEASVELRLDPHLPSLPLMPQDIGRVIQNLASNACYALHRARVADGAGYSPSLEVTTRDVGAWVELRLRDNGEGIPEAIQHKLFTPFFTTKPAGQGTGLGLSLSHDIVVQGHGGTLQFTSSEGGTEFIVTLPKRAEARPG